MPTILARLLLICAVTPAAAFNNGVSQSLNRPTFISHSTMTPMLLPSLQLTLSDTNPMRKRQRPFPRLSEIKMAIESTIATPEPNKPTTAVYALILLNLIIFLLDKVLQLPSIPLNLYLFHSRHSWYQPLTATFCHANRSHLRGNIFLLLLFGRSVEDELGQTGLLLSYIFCGVAANLVSLLVLPSNTVSLGASGAVFGLFAVSTLSKILGRKKGGLVWRKIVEVLVLGEFVFGKIVEEVSTVAGGGVTGVNHVAHLAGAGAGAGLIFFMWAVVNRFEKKEE